MVDSITTSQTNSKRRQSLARSFLTAFAGIARALNSQRNMKIHLLCALTVVVFGLLIPLDLATRATLLFCIALVFFAEVLNTALEAIVDLYTGEYHRLAMVAKDAAAGGVLILAIATTFIFADIVWTRADIIRNHWSTLSAAMKIVAPLMISEAMGLFLRPKKWTNALRYFLSLAFLVLLLPNAQDPIFCMAAFILISLSAYATHTNES